MVNDPDEAVSLAAKDVLDWLTEQNTAKNTADLPSGAVRRQDAGNAGGERVISGNGTAADKGEKPGAKEQTGKVPDVPPGREEISDDKSSQW
jgi:hypothetical protein